MAPAETVSMLLEHDNAALQLQPTGERVLTYMSASECVAIAQADGQVVALPDTVMEELREVFSNFQLDGFYEAGTYTICDGRAPQATAVCFPSRMRKLESLARANSSKLRSVKVQPAYAGPEMDEALFHLGSANPRLLVRISDDEAVSPNA
jgi:hypothetical protein